ncbi:MAG: YbhB/YbcL family Raf kinase inhibitor-like protein, partial [Candidatus Zixiibacteriota bacterium]
RGTWVHWVIYNLPPDLKEMPEGISRDLTPVIGTDSSGMATHGMTDFRRLGYGGPCPPPGPAHRYFFKLYALDLMLAFDAEKMKKGITAGELTEAMKGHILAEASLMGKYKR